MKRILLAAILCLSIQFTEAQSKAKFYTSFGTFTVFLEDTIAPITAGNFIDLVNTGFYDSVYIHRIVPNFVIQGGDGARSGKTVPPVIQDEFSPLLSNVEKTISMANAGPNTGTSQFFINLKDNTGLDYNKAPTSSAHPVFGAVIEGWSVVQTIGQQPNSGPPSNTATPLILMDSVRILPPPVSIVENNDQQQFGLFPNPANRWIRVRSNSEGNIKIVSLDAKWTLEKNVDSDELIDISELPAGIYVCHFENDQFSQSRKLLITRP